MEIKKLMEIQQMKEFIKELFDTNFLEKASREEKRRELEAEYPEYQGCRNKNNDDWDMRESDYL